MTPSAFIEYRVYSTDGKIFEMKKEDEIRKSKTDAKRISKDQDAYQQSFLISLLVCNGFEIVINRLYKKSNLTSQTFSIQSISRDDFVYFNQDTFQTQYTNLKEKRQNLDCYVNNLMIQLLENEGYVFEERKTRRVIKSFSIKMKRIKSFYHHGKIVSNVQLLEEGKICHQNIRSRISTKHGCVLLPNDYILRSSLSSSLSDSNSF